MADVVDKATRSRMMSGIRAKNTHPEIFMRQGLHALGFRFRLHAKDIQGKPDIVLPKFQALIVVHGCFWHGHGCRYFKLPSTRPEFWQAKIESNRAKDERDVQNHSLEGWRVLTVWECAIRASMKKAPSLNCVALAAQWLAGDTTTAMIDEQGLRRI